MTSIHNLVTIDEQAEFRNDVQISDYEKQADVWDVGIPLRYNGLAHRQELQYRENHNDEKEKPKTDDRIFFPGIHDQNEQHNHNHRREIDV